MFGCQVDGFPTKLCLLAAAAAAVAWPSGYGASILLGVPAVCVAHEVGHCRAAQKSGLSAQIRMTSWLPVTIVHHPAPMPRPVIAAGVCCSLKLGLLVLVSTAVLVSIAATADSVLGSAVASEWAAAAGHAMVGASAISLVDAVINLVPSAVSSALAAAAAAGAGLWALAAAACIILAFSVLFRPINDGDLLCRQTGALAALRIKC